MKLEAALIDAPFTTLAAVPMNHEIRTYVHRILALAVETPDRVRTPLAMSQKIVQYLFKTSSQLGREIYVTLLEQLCQSFEEVAKEAITWLIYAEDEVGFCFCRSLPVLTMYLQRKFNIPVTVTLLRSSLVSVSAEDHQLAKLLFENPRPSLQDFSAGLIRECLLSDPPVATQQQFSYTIEALTQLTQANKATEQCV